MGQPQQFIDKWTNVATILEESILFSYNLSNYFHSIYFYWSWHSKPALALFINVIKNESGHGNLS